MRHIVLSVTHDSISNYLSSAATSTQWKLHNLIQASRKYNIWEREMKLIAEWKRKEPNSLTIIFNFKRLKIPSTKDPWLPLSVLSLLKTGCNNEFLLSDPFPWDISDDNNESNPDSALLTLKNLIIVSVCYKSETKLLFCVEQRTLKCMRYTFCILIHSLPMFVHLRFSIVMDHKRIVRNSKKEKKKWVVRENCNTEGFTILTWNHVIFEIFVCGVGKENITIHRL